MVKVKKNNLKKKNLSEMRKSDPKKKTLNPFEIHVNRQKYNVIGRKSKSDKGVPGISRSKAMKKRKATILQEYKIKDKSNQFHDRRIGEKNSAMTNEDRMIARFTKERMKRHSKKNIFNLDDDEVLTHHGQTLNEIEKFENPVSDDEDEDEKGKLEADFVEEAHFGGGVLKKVDGEKPSRKDLIEQLIAESKKRKAEKQRVREQTLELTEKLDTEWKDLLPIVATSKKGSDNFVEDNKPDSFDTLMRELKFEARGKPSDPLKSEEVLAKEEEERIAKLEAERLKRMSGFSNQPAPGAKHRSADDLDDGFAIESDIEEAITYDEEGCLVNKKDEAVDDKELERNQEVSDEDDSSDEDDVDDGEEDEEEGKEEVKEVKSSEKEEESDGEKDETEGAEEDDDGDEKEEEMEEEDEDSLSDLRPQSESETEEEDRVTTGKTPVEETRTAKKVTRPSEKMEVDCSPNTLSEKQKKDFIAAVQKKFPNVSQVPDKYEDLQSVLDSYGADHQAVIVEHIIKVQNVNSKQKLETLFAYLLQYLHDAPVPNTEDKARRHCFSVLNRLAPHLYDLAHLNADNAWRCVIEVLKEKQQNFRKHPRRYPDLDTLVFLKVISLLFPTSDFRHPVVTPALVFMCQMLMQCRVRTKRDIASGLFLVALMLEYTVLSKRFSPAAVNFLRGVVYSAVPKSPSNPSPPVPPFKKSGDLASLLVLDDHRKDMEDDEDDDDPSPHSMLLGDLSEDTPIDESFKVRALYTAVTMLNEFHENLEPLPACGELFKPMKLLLTKLQLDKYPSYLREKVQTLISTIDKSCEKKLQFLVVEKTRAKALRLYEPQIEHVFDGKRRRPMGQEKREHEKLVHKFKRERKAAVREIRRDNYFISKLKWKDAIKSDMERNRKVREIFGAAATQQGELRQLKRKK